MTENPSILRYQFFYDGSLKCPIWKSVFHENHRVHKLNDLPLNDLSNRNQPGCCNFLIFIFGLKKLQRERGPWVLLQLPLGRSMDFVGGPLDCRIPSESSWCISGYFRSQTHNANPEVLADLLQFWKIFKTLGFRFSKKCHPAFVEWVKPPVARSISLIFVRLPQVKLIRSSSTFCAQALEICGCSKSAKLKIR